MPPPPPKLDVDLWGEVSSWDISWGGVLLEDVDAASTDGRVIVYIPKGTKVLGLDGEPLDEIVVTPVNPFPTSPDDYHVIAAFDFEPHGTTFDPRIELTLAYGPDALPEGVREADLVIALLDEATWEWEFVTGVVDTDANTITFSIDDFSLFAILAAPAPTPTLTPTPTPTPAPGLGAGVWTGIGIAILAALLVVARRRIAILAALLVVARLRIAPFIRRIISQIKR